MKQLVKKKYNTGKKLPFVRVVLFACPSSGMVKPKNVGFRVEKHLGRHVSVRGLCFCIGGLVALFFCTLFIQLKVLKMFCCVKKLIESYLFIYLFIIKLVLVSFI